MKHEQHGPQYNKIKINQSNKGLKLQKFLATGAENQG